MSVIQNDLFPPSSITWQFEWRPQKRIGEESWDDEKQDGKLPPEYIPLSHFGKDAL